MEIRSITVRRRERYEGHSAKAFKAEICLTGGQTYPADINLTITDEILEPIIGIVAQAAAHAMTGATEQFHEDVKAMLAGPAIDAAALTEQGAAA
jgi:hypothetical protein